MPLLSSRGVRLPLFTLSALVFVLLFWLLQPRSEPPAQPIPDWPALEQDLLQPLAAGTLDLAALRERAPGALWLQVRPDGPRLLHRAERGGAGLTWQVQAELAATSQALSTLRGELGLERGEQRLDSAQTRRFEALAVDSLWLQAEPAPSAAAWLASVGEPRLRLQMPPAQAWVYPPRGLTAHVQDERISLIHQVPAQAMRGGGR